jgi:hypothetical protein
MTDADRSAGDDDALLPAANLWFGIDMAMVDACWSFVQKRAV